MMKEEWRKNINIKKICFPSISVLFIIFLFADTKGQKWESIHFLTISYSIAKTLENVA